MTKQIETLSNNSGIAILVTETRSRVGNFSLTIAVTGIDNPHATEMAKVIAPYLDLGENDSDSAWVILPDDMGLYWTPETAQ